MHTTRPSQIPEPPEPVITPNQRFSMVRTLTFAVVLTGVLSVTGCQSSTAFQYNKFCDKVLSQKIACFEATQAWWSYKNRFRGDYASDAKRGFIAGYRCQAMGRDCRAPIVPERRYWSTWYQSGYGQQKINAWYQGYPLGVAAARVHGHGYHLRTPVTEEVSAYFAATSPMARQEARAAMVAHSAHQDAGESMTVPMAHPPSPDVIGDDFTEPKQPSAEHSQRQPAVREYLDLPSDTTELTPPNYKDDPFLNPTTNAVNQFETEARSAFSGVGKTIEDGSQKINRFAGDLPAALQPGRN